MRNQPVVAVVAGICVITLAIAMLIGMMTAATPPASAADAPPVAMVAAAKDGVTLELRPPAGTSGMLEAELRDVKGVLLASEAQKNTGRAVRMKLDAEINPADPAGYYVRYRFGAKSAYEQRSLYLMSEILDTTVLGQRDWIAGTRPVVRVLVKDRSRNEPVAGADVAVSLAHDNKPLAAFRGRTNARGELAAPLDLPTAPVRGAALTVEVRSKTADDVVRETVQIRKATKTLLTTDKPLYQPGQTIHIRALSLDRPDMKPLARADVTLEVEDAKGNKVFKHATRTDAYGISHADFVLADELNMGAYRVRAIVAGAKEERSVTVSRYVLPKFKPQLKTDRQFYKPGDEVIADLQADYFFGKPVANAKVQVRCWKFDVRYVEFQKIDARTDAKGHCRFEVTLPKHFVGQPLEAGKASARFDIAVTDTADHTENITRNVTVTASPILVAAVPESGGLVRGLQNRIHVVSNLADASPVSCSVTWKDPPGGEPITIQTDQSGFGHFTITPADDKPITMQLEARGRIGDTGSATIKLEPKKQSGDDRVLLRTERTIHRVGEEVKATIYCTRKTGPVYVDLIKDRQTYLTKTVELKGGKAATSIGLTGGLSGTLQLNAYLIGVNGVIVRDRRLMLVDPANDLRISVTSDQDTYLPGKAAAMKFKVTNQAGKGVPSALGVMVVDEAVFALQEMQPGLEKVYFYLEKEIAKPRYEIHGYTLGGIMPVGPVRPLGPMPMPRAAKRRDAAARVLLASAKGVGKYAIHVNTFTRDNKGGILKRKLQQVLAPRMNTITQAMLKFSQAHRDPKKRRKEPLDLATLVAEGLLKPADTVDPWGHAMKIAGRWQPTAQFFRDFKLTSPGIDGQWGSDDDVTADWQMARPANGLFGGGRLRLMAQGGVARRFNMLEGNAALAPMAKGAVRKTAAARPGGGAEPPRIRRHFPETLYFNPAVITDPRGLASLEIPLADSITTWRLTCMGSAAGGELGSTTSGIRVFQDFFVDVDFPVSLTQNDEVHVPVVVYNYLKSDQAVRLKVKPEDWFELKADEEITLKLAASEVRSVHFPIVARRVGMQTFTVFGYGAKKSDAVARTVEIAPDGKEFVVSHSGRLKGGIRHDVTIPKGAIEGASTIFVKVYPGTLSQVVEGLDKMLRMPFGCFEQTSSVTYPNVLVMDYMKTTGKITPEVQMKAQGFINAGYQRLLSFEVAGGGFEWFGRAPAHRILTAFGLMEFHDMSKVHEVDPAIIARTQQWLARCQEADGAYKPSKGGIREGAINKFTDDVFRNTAYITWALASSGYRGGQVAKGLGYLRKHLDDMKDTYTIALTANTFAAVEPKSKTAAAVLQVLFDKRTEEDDLIYWKATSQTPTHGRGNVADIEVTALAVQAMVRAEWKLSEASRAVTYLTKKKDSYGTWHSTQATIQSLRAMLMAERGATIKADATIDVALNGESFQKLRIDEHNSDVLRLVDLKQQTRTGDNEVGLTFAGKGQMMYQVVGRYWLPRPKGPRPEIVEPMTITVDYDRTKLEASDVIAVKATVTNNRPGTAKMVIVDLGLPPGFTLMADKLDKLVKSKAIEKYSTTGRQIIVYLREVTAEKPVKISYELLAKYPLKAKTPKSVVYEYYNPQIRSEAPPVQLAVAKKGAAK